MYIWRCGCCVLCMCACVCVFTHVGFTVAYRVVVSFEYTLGICDDACNHSIDCVYMCGHACVVDTEHG